MGDIETDDPLAYYRRRNKEIQDRINQNWRRSTKLTMNIVHVPMQERDRRNVRP